MSILKRIRWGRVLTAGASILCLSYLIGDADESTPTTDQSPEIQNSELLDSELLDSGALRPGDNALLLNRPWIDHMPKNERDMVTQLIFVDRDGQKMGAMLRASRWRQLAELFRWQSRSNGLTVEFPQSNKRLPVSTRVWACRDAPEGFDLCLEISLLGRGVRLYSNKKWKIDEARAADFLPFEPDAVDPSMDDELLYAELEALLSEP